MKNYGFHKSKIYHFLSKVTLANDNYTRISIFISFNVLYTVSTPLTILTTCCYISTIFLPLKSIHVFFSFIKFQVEHILQNLIMNVVQSIPM